MIGPGIVPGFSYLCRRKHIYVRGISQPANPGNVVKRGPDSFLPGMVVFKPFSGHFVPGWYNLSFLPGNAVKSKIREN